MTEAIDTFYAPAERADETELLFQINLVKEVPLIKELFDSVPVFVAILNRQRQIIFANKAFTEFFKSHNLLNYLGKRTGESVDCIHSHETTGGCGTSKACSVCGAVNSILVSQKCGSAQSECRITLENKESLDLMIFTSQYLLNSREFTIFAAADISDQKRRKALERIFFHDILNTSGALKGLLEILADSTETEKEEYINLSTNVADHLINEIIAQKELTLAEDNELKIHVSSFSTNDILKEVKLLYEKHSVSLDKTITVIKTTEDLIVQTDKTLLRRTLGNLTKNALEAIHDKEEVILNCRRQGDLIEFTVSNNAVIPKDLQYQIFQRSFSTKGAGRGLGTYSVKLLTERYLKGCVGFSSNEENGTTFYIRIPFFIEEN